MADVCIPSSAGTGNLNLLCSLDLAGKAAGTYSVSMQKDISRLSALQVILSNLLSPGTAICYCKLALGGYTIVDTRASNNKETAGCCHLLLFAMEMRTEALGLRHESYIAGGSMNHNDVVAINLPSSGTAWTVTLSGAISTGRLEIYGA